MHPRIHPPELLSLDILCPPYVFNEIYVVILLALLLRIHHLFDGDLLTINLKHKMCFLAIKQFCLSVVQLPMVIGADSDDI